MAIYDDLLNKLSSLSDSAVGFFESKNSKLSLQVDNSHIEDNQNYPNDTGDARNYVKSIMQASLANDGAKVELSGQFLRDANRANISINNSRLDFDDVSGEDKITQITNAQNVFSENVKSSLESNIKWITTDHINEMINVFGQAGAAAPTMPLLTGADSILFSLNGDYKLSPTHGVQYNPSGEIMDEVVFDNNNKKAYYKLERFFILGKSLDEVTNKRTELDFLIRDGKPELKYQITQNYPNSNIVLVTVETVIDFKQLDPNNINSFKKPVDPDNPGVKQVITYESKDPNLTFVPSKNFLSQGRVVSIETKPSNFFALLISIKTKVFGFFNGILKLFTKSDKTTLSQSNTTVSTKIYNGNPNDSDNREIVKPLTFNQKDKEKKIADIKAEENIPKPRAKVNGTNSLKPKN